MTVNYKAYEFQCYEQIRRMEMLLSLEGGGEAIQTWRRSARHLREALESRRFRVAVVGEFNRGKTSFINALLGKEILPADYMPTTAAINRITYSDTPSAYIVLKNGQKKYVEISELAGYITKLSASALENASKIDEAVVQFPSLFCRNGVDLLDTPGMNDEEAMNQVTVSRLEDIDLAIVAVDASMPFSMTECVFTVQLLESPQVCQIILVITKIDTIRQNERQKLIDFMAVRVREDIKLYLEKRYSPNDPILQKYHAIFDNLCVFAVSSLDALDALARNDMDLFRNSGFMRLNDELPQIILNSQNSNVILNSERVLSGIIQSYREWLVRQRETRREHLPQLDMLKQDFLRLCGETSRAIAAVSVGDGLPDVEQETAVIRKRFIQALGQMRTLDYSVLQDTFIPVMKTVFQSLNQQFATEERAWMEDYQKQVLDPIKNRLCEKLHSLLKPFPPVHAVLADRITAMPVCLQEPDGGPERFFWTVSPLPKPAQLGTDWQVMPVVDVAIRSSLMDYQKRREQRVVTLCTQARERMDAAARDAAEELAAQAGRYIRYLADGGEEQPILEKLDRLEADCLSMRESFLAELGKTDAVTGEKGESVE